MKLSFFGAAKQVTGSMYLLTLDSGYKILIDCGMDYEMKKNPVARAQLFPFEPVTVDLVILTHAHIDHSGNLPALVGFGFRPPWKALGRRYWPLGLPILGHCFRSWIRRLSESWEICILRLPY
jgi:glyoxylase-like metal-dependent hydrolase (beta-lactamase superfamily II)